jgi:hypothetical protein
VEDQKGLTQEEHGTLLGRLSASVATLAALATLQRLFHGLEMIFKSAATLVNSCISMYLRIL